MNNTVVTLHGTQYEVKVIEQAILQYCEEHESKHRSEEK